MRLKPPGKDESWRKDPSHWLYTPSMDFREKAPSNISSNILQPGTPERPRFLPYYTGYIAEFYRGWHMNSGLRIGLSTTKLSSWSEHGTSSLIMGFTLW